MDPNHPSTMRFYPVSVHVIQKGGKKIGTTLSLVSKICPNVYMYIYNMATLNMIHATFSFI